MVACSKGKATAGEPDAEDSAEEVPPLAIEVLKRGRRLKAAADSSRGVVRVDDGLERGRGGEGGGELEGIAHSCGRRWRRYKYLFQEREWGHVN